ncbi:hypothetical protein [Devosia insulae]|nr:hypothetical protein [Devosia insulae]
MARNRPKVSRQLSEFDRLCGPKRVVYRYAEAAHRGLDLGMTF